MQEPTPAPTIADEVPIDEGASALRHRAARPPLLTIGIAVFLLLTSLAQWLLAGGRSEGGAIGNLFADWALGAKLPSLVAHGEYWRLITASFLHGSWIHLILNLLALGIFGRAVEMWFGRARAFVIFVFSCVSGAVVSYLLTPSPSLGASTGIMGLLGALAVHHFRNRHRLPDQARQAYPMILLVLYLQLLVDQLGSGFNIRVDSRGHIGGMIGGMILAALLEGEPLDGRDREREWLPLPTALTTAIVLLAYGFGGLIASLPGQVGLLRAASAVDLSTRVAYLRDVADRYPHFAELNAQVAGLLQQVNRPEEAQEYFRRASGDARMGRFSATEREGIALAAWERAQIALRRKNYDVALPGFLQAAELTSNDELRAQAYNSYAWVLVDELKRDYDRAELYAQKALQLAPTNPMIIDTLAWVWCAQGRCREAEERQKVAIQLLEQRRGPLDQFLNSRDSPDHQLAEYYYHLGVMQEKQHKTVEARTTFGKALLLRRPFPEVEEGLRRLSRPVKGAPVTPEAEVEQDPAVRRGIL